MNKIVIYVSGGVVQAACANEPIEVRVFDVDDKKEEGKTEKQIDKAWQKETKGMTNVY